MGKAAQRWSRSARAILGAVFALAVAGSAGAEPPKAYRIDPAGISVSGISSGAFMAHQVHVAHSSDIMGIGVIAGGPYNCARNDLYRGMQVCADFLTEYCAGFERLCERGLRIVRGPDGVPLYQGPRTDAEAAGLAEESVREVRAAFQAGAIDDPAGLRRARVYLFSATLDRLVPMPVVSAVGHFYTKMGVGADQIRFVDSVPSLHAMITDNYNDLFTGVGGRINECRETGLPYINDCRAEAPDEADVAGNLLKHIYGPLNERVRASGRVHRFAQSRFIVDPERSGMDADGFVYVPERCAQGTTACRLHVALHGCRQGEDKIGMTFVQHSGYNEWAEANDIIVLYPQAQTIDFATPARPPFPPRHCDNLSINPRGCWDWWGYAGPDPHLRTGRQVAAIKAMVDHLAGLMGPPPALQLKRDGASASLRWTGLTATGLAGYNVYRADTHPVATTAANRLNAALLTATAFVDTGREAGRDHVYVVTAVGGDGSETLPSLPVSTERLCEFCVCWPLDAAPRCAKTFCW